MSAAMVDHFLARSSSAVPVVTSAALSSTAMLFRPAGSSLVGARVYETMTWQVSPFGPHPPASVAAPRNVMQIVTLRFVIIESLLRLVQRRKAPSYPHTVMFTRRKVG